MYRLLNEPPDNDFLVTKVHAINSMSQIWFNINGKRYEVDGSDVSLNDYIRNVADLRGTKAMCHRGGCGACIVAVSAPLPPDHQIKHFAVNSCLVSVLSCHGWDVTTIEGVGNRTIGYHDIQSRLAMFNGTQCGFCTPGMIMSMYSIYKSRNKLTSEEIENSFASNKCRCTGYRPIIEAFKTFATDADQSLMDKLVDLEDLAIFKSCGVKCADTCRHQKCNLNIEEPDDFTFLMDNKMLAIEYGEKKTWHRVYTLDDAFKAMMVDSDYMLIAGNTGQGLYEKIKQHPRNVIDIFNVSEIKGYTLDVNLILGAGMPLSEMMKLFQDLSADKEEFSYLQQFYDHMDLVAHIPVKNIGTIGGNLFLKYLYNDFQSDLFILFETVGAMLTIAESATSNKIVTLPYFLKMNMKGRIIKSILLPPLSERCFVNTYKIMPCSQNSLAVVNAGFLFKFHQNSHVIEKATIVYGNISPTFIHAKKTEAVLVGKELFTEQTLDLALETLAQEIVPVEAPPEPSPRYRKMLAITLYYKAILYICPDDILNPTYKSGGDVIKRQTSKSTQSFETDQTVWPLNQPVPKIEAMAQCSGEATFANDLPAEVNEVFAAYVTADVIPGSIIKGFETSEAMKTAGVIVFYSAKDIPGDNNFTPTDAYISEQEIILCEKEVKFYGQPAGIIVADSEKIAVAAAKLVSIKYSRISSNKPLLSVEDVLESPYKKKRVRNDNNVDPSETGHDVKKVVYGEMRMESQYHFYMEPQTCVVKPTEDGLEVYSATQWLDLTNIAIARCLKVPLNSVNVVVRRVGGSYGGKVSRSVQIACSAALVTHLLGRSCRFVLPLETNMKSIGKRFATSCKFEVGVNNDGVIQYLNNDIYQNTGCSYNESMTILTIKACYNSYEHKRWKMQSSSVLTDTPSNTACRAPFTAEGVAMIEHIMEKIAHSTGKDALEVRLSNINKDHPIPEMIDQLKKDANFNARKRNLVIFNEENRWRKRAIKMIPLSYNIIFAGTFNATISIYHGDGTVVLIHSGIDMGQGLNTKVAQVCAYKLGIPLDKVSVKPSTSFTTPNAFATGGSMGSESVAFAVIKACEILNKRLEPYKKDKRKWEEVINKASEDDVDLKASYTFSAKNDGVKAYDVYAVCMMELEVDILTGNHDVLRVDILEDTGRSLNPEIDVAQIEGAFVMGLGYWTSEKLVFDKSTGKLLTDNVNTYRIPGMKDIPADMRVYFRRGARNEDGVLQSKATGEPALCLATVFTHAAREAVRAARLEAGYEDIWVDIENPCTVENIFMAIGHKLDHFKLK